MDRVPNPSRKQVHGVGSGKLFGRDRLGIIGIGGSKWVNGLRGSEVTMRVNAEDHGEAGTAPRPPAEKLTQGGRRL